MSCGTINGRNADGAVTLGLLRVLQTENPVSQYISIDIDADNFGIGNDEEIDLAHCIIDHEFALHQSVSSVAEGNAMNDHEFSWHDGCLWVSRHVPDGGFHSQHGVGRESIKPEILPLNVQGPVRAIFEMPGVVNSLCFRSYDELLQPLPPGFIDVKIAAIGLNSMDMETWSGRVDSNYLSTEYSGTIASVGAEVSGLSVGDRVYGIGQGHFGTYTRVVAKFAKKLHLDDDMVQMATMPMAYVTAIYALDHIAHVRQEQYVLIQSGTSDIGLAAINIAKAKGASVFAVVNTPEQASFLSAEMVIPPSHIALTPDSTSLRDSAKMIPKGGFDVVMSTDTSGILTSLPQLLVPLGYLIHLGQVDVQSTHAELFQKNITQCSLDPSVLLDPDSSLGAELMQATDSYYRQGLIGPIPRSTTTDVAQLSQTQTISDAIGKTVVTFTKSSSPVRMIPSPPRVKFNHEACYVITGAFGGLGQSIIRWMVDRGVRYLALLSRRDIASVPGAQILVKSLVDRGIYVESAVCDVSNKDQLTSAINQISSVRPIKGIVHAAVSYRDLTFDKLSASRWNEGLSAKVQGSKNLHDATLSMPLDFFVMTTSALSVYAFATQGPYTAANNFQDAFARYRRKLGLPASTVSFSLVHDLTDVGSDPITVGLFERNKTLTLGESQFLALLEPAFLNNSTGSGSVQWSGQEQDPLSAANLHTYLDPAALMSKKRGETEGEISSTATIPRWYGDGRVSLMMRAFLDAQRISTSLSGAVDEGSKNTVAYLGSEFDAAIQTGITNRDSTIEFVQRSIINAVAEMLFISAEGIDSSKSVADQGVDSLIAAELRNWFSQALRTNISMLDLLDPSVSIGTLAGKITDEALETKV
jgi:NADPH:quinone reductase-like Zn-dependent oxidoreductase/NADP-dependent 3-hydroxy acid dehydrogenase YdfG